MPRASGQKPAATAAAEPLDEPPGVWPGLPGLRVGPGAEDMALPLSRSAQRLRETVMAGYSRGDIEVIERFLSDIVAALKLRNEGLEAEFATKTTDRHPRA